MPRRRPNRLPRRVRRLLRLALARARRQFRLQPRPTLEQVVDTVAQLETQLERLPSARRAVAIMQDIIVDLNDAPEPPLREARSDSSPETPSAANDYLDSPPESPLPSYQHPDPPRDNECSICFERNNEVILNCSGRHAFCGQCPSQMYKRDAKCPLCRDNFSEITPLFGVPILRILPLEGRCTILPELEFLNLTFPEDLELLEMAAMTPRPRTINLEPLDFQWPPVQENEDWNVEVNNDPLPPLPVQLNLRDLYSPIYNGQYQCLGCLSWLNDRGTNLIHHLTICQCYSRM